jgi:hypothetical protein
MKSVLEEQIAQRLMSSKRDNEQRLSEEQKALRHAEQLFEKSILEEHNKKKTETALLKQEWSKQVSIHFFSHSTLLFLCLLRILYCSWALFVGMS